MRGVEVRQRAMRLSAIRLSLPARGRKGVPTDDPRVALARCRTSARPIGERHAAVAREGGEVARRPRSRSENACEGMRPDAAARSREQGHALGCAPLRSGARRSRKRPPPSVRLAETSRRMKRSRACGDRLIEHELDPHVVAGLRLPSPSRTMRAPTSAVAWCRRAGIHCAMPLLAPDATRSTTSIRCVGAWPSGARIARRGASRPSRSAVRLMLSAHRSPAPAVLPPPGSAHGWSGFAPTIPEGTRSPRHLPRPSRREPSRHDDARALKHEAAVHGEPEQSALLRCPMSASAASAASR